MLWVLLGVRTLTGFSLHRLETFQVKWLSDRLMASQWSAAILSYE